MRAVRTTGVPDAPIVVVDAAVPAPAAGQALVRVHAISLNPGELRRSRSAQPGNPFGWDFAGTVERAAADGTGPAAGARVVGFVGAGAWADYVAAPTPQLGVLPHGVAFHDAATLPVAGLTALRTLRRGGDLDAKAVLVVPGTGGVGLFALQLARRAGATVTTVIRNAANDVLVRGHGAHTVVVGTTADAGHETKYDLILESLGGESLGAALGMLRPDGTVVSFGQTVHASTTFASADFYATGGATLYGFILFHEAQKVPVTADLEHLAALVEAGELAATIDATLSFDRITDAVSLRSERGLPGKIVVTLRD
jgi:NADPH:quinone reductase-like Zn-dependent oxidoreductase